MEDWEKTGTGILLKVQREQEKLRFESFLYKLDEFQAEEYKEQFIEKQAEAIDVNLLRKHIELMEGVLGWN